VQNYKLRWRLQSSRLDIDRKKTDNQPG